MFLSQKGVEFAITGTRNQKQSVVSRAPEVLQCSVASLGQVLFETVALSTLSSCLSDLETLLASAQIAAGNLQDKKRPES